MLRHVHHRVPVTALAFLEDDVILAGEGNLLHAYDIHTGAKRSSLGIFQRQSIHGIVSDHDRRNVIVWGGSLLKTLVRRGKAEYEPRSTQEATDWILDAALSQDGSSIALVTAHNALTVLDVASLAHEAPHEPLSLEPCVPGSNCILYAAHVTWLSASQCLIASGTAFGDIVVWSASLSKTADGTYSAEAHTHYTFSAHEGSVFGVRLSSTTEASQLGRGYERLLASCSDDRQVKLWDISNLSVDGPTLTQVQRDTGFGSKNEDDHAPPLLAKEMGHVSRIWQVRFAQAGGAQGLCIVSFGEDASNITWNIDRAKDNFALRQVAVQTAHAGKHIWSVAIAEDGRLATGGADGAIAVRSAATPPSGPIEVDTVALEPKDFFRAYGFVDDGILLATTNSGRVMKLVWKDKDTLDVEEISLPITELRGYSLVSSVPGLTAVAGHAGTVYLYIHQTKGLIHLMSGERKVSGLWISKSSVGEAETVHLLHTNAGTSGAKLTQLMEDMTSIDPSADTALKSQRTLTSLPEGFVVTSFAMVGEPTFEVELALIGARNGSIAIVETSSNRASSLMKLAPHVHGKEAVTALQYVANKDSTPYLGFLHSTGRDGMHAIHRLSLTREAREGREQLSLELQLVHQLELPLGPNIEGLLFRPDDALWIYGFKGKHFVVFDATAQTEIMTIECGGAHRSFAFQPNIDGGMFVWTKASRLFHYRQSRRPHWLINGGGHGREITAVATSPSKPQIMATGAEDTNIKLSTLSQGDGGSRCLQTLRKHVTGIQHLQWSHDGRYLFSSGGFEEFYVWRVTENVPHIRIGAFCQSRHVRSGKSDLRVMGFEVIGEEYVSEGRTDFDLVLAYSDSTLKRWMYGGEGWSLMSSGDYLTACLTHVLHSRDSGVLTTATDGHLTRWQNGPDGESLTWRTRQQIHQNAILAVASREMPDKSLVVITAGDDNAIALTRVVGDKGIKTLLMPHAHAAAITGLAFMPIGGSEDKIQLVSASIDQRVKLWNVTIDVSQPGVEGIDVRLRRNVPTSVADVASLEVCRLGGDPGKLDVIVCGVGIDLWRIDEHDDGKS